MSTMSTSPDPAQSLDETREKYRQERDKRVRSAGTDQYIFVDGEFARFAEDPYTPELVEREPVAEELDVLIVGAGFGGLQTGATLQKNGVTSVRMVDVAGDVGGTWYWNRYPGLRCDVESYIYLPYLEETGYVPTERYIRGAEILAYCQLLARHFDLYDKALFQTRITGMSWDAGSRRWVVTTDRGDELRARFVTTQSGIFNRPQLPGIPGITEFEGAMFHSARWDYEVTGGDPDGAPMSDLADKNVAVIGTGASGIQVVPELAKTAQKLVVFQRTPSTIAVRDNGPTDVEWFKSLPSGWQTERIWNFAQVSNFEDVPSQVDDGWTRLFRTLIEAGTSLPAGASPEEIAEAQEVADLQYMESLRARVDANVSDLATAEILKPYYRAQCKRPGFSDNFLPTFNQPNVRLVDVSTGDISVTRTGVIANGETFDIDCIVLATGFELGTTWDHQAGYDVIGRDGARLSEKFSEGAKTYHGLFSVGFPNIFFMGLTQSGATFCLTHMLQEQADHIAYIVKRAAREGIAEVEATADAEAGWQDALGAINSFRRPFQESCTPGQFNAEGKPDDTRSGLASGFFAPATELFRIWSKWREAGDFEGLRLVRD